MPTPQELEEFRFAVAFSFAGPHRDKMRAIAELIRAKVGDGKVFYDDWFEDELGGDEAEVELQWIYEKRSLMVVADVSDDYSDRPWCQAEASAIRAFRMGLETARSTADRLRLAYIRFDDGEVPGVAQRHHLGRKKEDCAATRRPRLEPAGKTPPGNRYQREIGDREDRC